jgi:dihydrodipicolinate synthase/N-acetylneuraminate lyase
MEMFSRGKRNIDIAKEITGMGADEILSIQEDYWKLNNAEELARIYANSKVYLSSLLLLYSHMRQENIDKEDLVYALKNFKELRLLNEEIFSAIDHLERLSKN